MKSALQKYYEDVLNHGTKAKPRGLETVQLLDQSFWFYPGQVYVRPHINLAIGFVELLQFISGSFDIEPFKIVAPNARLDLFTGQSAYGPRVVNQLPRVIDELRKDQDTRRAVMMIAHPTDTPETLPCTLSMQFQIYEDKDQHAFYLSTIVNMRSSDLMWGIPTDIIQFGGMALMVAQCVGAIPSTCVVNAGNAHIYDKTKLKPGEQYDLGGHFKLPDLHTVEEFRNWAKTALVLITDTKISVKEIFEYNKVEKDKVEVF